MARDNSDDYIGGFLQNFSPDTIQEFAVRTAQEDADTGRHHRRLRGHHHQARHRRLARRASHFTIAPPPSTRAFPSTIPRPIPSSHSPGRTTSARIGGPIKKDKVWFFSRLRIRPRKRQHRLQRRQPDAIQCAIALASEGLDSRRQFDSRAQQRSRSLPRLLGSTAFRLGAIATLAMVSARLRRQLHSPTTPLVQQATLPSTGADHAQQLLERRDRQSPTPSVPPGWAPSLSAPANCTSRRRATRTSASRSPFLSVPRP